MIGGNLYATIQKANTGGKNAIGEQVTAWVDTGYTYLGFLDLLGAEANKTLLFKKLENSTHVFIGDYDPNIVSTIQTGDRLVIKNQIYDVEYLDDPMELHQHLEIYLKYIGDEHVY